MLNRNILAYKEKLEIITLFVKAYVRAWNIFVNLIHPNEFLLCIFFF